MHAYISCKDSWIIKKKNKQKNVTWKSVANRIIARESWLVNRISSSRPHSQELISRHGRKKWHIFSCYHSYFMCIFYENGAFYELSVELRMNVVTYRTKIYAWTELGRKHLVKVTNEKVHLTYVRYLNSMCFIWNARKTVHITSVVRIFTTAWKKNSLRNKNTKK